MKKIKHAIGIFLTLHCLILTAAAAESIKAVQTHTGESEIAIYVKGVDEGFSDASVQIGTAECKSVKSGRLSELKHPVKTLVMIDNSLSIPEPARAANAQILQNIISDREAYEQIAIATFDEEIRYLTEYASDYSALKAAVDNISYQNLETRLTDVLYGLLSEEYSKDTEDAYRRIVVFSDGVDSKSANCTKAELESMISERQIPIYTVGIGKDEAQLGEMFSLSRLSKGESFKLDGMENLMNINAALNADRNIVRFAISPQGELMDGSRKMVKISFASGASLSVEARMPQQMQTVESTPVKMETAAETVAETAAEETPEKPNTMIFTAVAALIALIAFAAIVFTVIRARKGRMNVGNQEEDLRKATEENQNKVEEIRAESRCTVMQTDTGTPRNTFFLFSEGTTRNIILTDMGASLRTFEVPLKDSVLIGYDGVCDIQITNDDYISGKHCTIKQRSGKFYLEDAHSSNGTFLNGSRISAMTEIVSGNIIKIGDTKLKFEVKQ